MAAPEPDAGPEPQADLVERAEDHPTRLPAELRKRRGAWFTPLELAAPTAARALRPLLGPAAATAQLRIVDPAVGGGVFLLAAAQLLMEAGFEPAAAAACLHGRDVDAEASKLAAAAVARQCRADHTAAAAIGERVRAGCGLHELEPGSFDCVLTNPPWETLHGDTDGPSDRTALRTRFVHQGRGKLFTYRLFVERAFQLLRPGGRLGLIVPASLWFDREAEPLRRLLLSQCRWEWLFGFENRASVFAIDRRFRFGAIVAEKGGSTERVQVAFGRTELAEWAAPVPPHVDYTVAELRALSPGSGAFVEVESRTDLEVMRTMAEHGEPLLGPRGAFTWQQGDFNMTTARGSFLDRAAAEAAGYRCGADAVWRRDGHPDLLPLYQGAMIGELHANAGAHAGGSGHHTRWVPPASPAALQPAYLVDAECWRQGAGTRSPVRLVHRALSNATNERTTIATLLPDQPTGNSLGVLQPRAGLTLPVRSSAATAAVLASLPFDWALRQRLGGTNLNGFVLADCVLPRLPDDVAIELARLCLRLCAVLPWHASLWHAARSEGWGEPPQPVTDAAARDAITTRIDVLVGRAFGLDVAAVQWLTRGCDGAAGARSGSPAKGFWRVERDRPPARRRPLRWRAAAADRSFTDT